MDGDGTTEFARLVADFETATASSFLDRWVSADG